MILGVPGEWRPVLIKTDGEGLVKMQVAGFLFEAHICSSARQQRTKGLA
jgi:hypothetical protein